MLFSPGLVYKSPCLPSHSTVSWTRTRIEMGGLGIGWWMFIDVYSPKYDTTKLLDLATSPYFAVTQTTISRHTPWSKFHHSRGISWIHGPMAWSPSIPGWIQMYQIWFSLAERKKILQHVPGIPASTSMECPFLGSSAKQCWCDLSWAKMKRGSRQPGDIFVSSCSPKMMREKKTTNHPQSTWNHTSWSIDNRYKMISHISYTHHIISSMVYHILDATWHVHTLCIYDQS